MRTDNNRVPPSPLAPPSPSAPPPVPMPRPGDGAPLHKHDGIALSETTRPPQPGNQPASPPSAGQPDRQPPTTPNKPVSMPRPSDGAVRHDGGHDIVTLAVPLPL